MTQITHFNIGKIKNTNSTRYNQGWVCCSEIWKPKGSLMCDVWARKDYFTWSEMNKLWSVIKQPHNWLNNYSLKADVISSGYLLNSKTARQMSTTFTDTDQVNNHFRLYHTETKGLVYFGQYTKQMGQKFNSWWDWAISSLQWLGGK